MKFYKTATNDSVQMDITLTILLIHSGAINSCVIPLAPKPQIKHLFFTFQLVNPFKHPNRPEGTRNLQLIG